MASDAVQGGRLATNRDELAPQAESLNCNEPQTATLRKEGAGVDRGGCPQAVGSFHTSEISEAELEYFRFVPDDLNLIRAPDKLSCSNYGEKQPAQTVRFFRAGARPSELFAQLSTARPGRTLLVRAKLIEIIAECFGRQIDIPSRSFEQTICQRFNELIEQLPEAELIQHRSEDLAGKFGCSVRHFSRMFRHKFGVSLRAKQTQLRLQKARELLLEGKSKIVQVAHESGYRNLGLFNATFKKYVGTTPSDWRKSQTQKS